MTREDEESRSEFISALTRACNIAGSQKEWAEQNGFSGAFVSSVLTKHKPPSRRILNSLGFELDKRLHPLGGWIKYYRLIKL